MLSIVVGYSSAHFRNGQILESISNGTLHKQKNVFVSVAETTEEAVNLVLEQGSYDRVFILQPKDMTEYEDYIVSDDFKEVCQGEKPFAFHISSGSDGDGWDGIEYGVGATIFCTESEIGKKGKDDYIRVFMLNEGEYFHHLGDNDFVPDDVIGCIWKGEEQIRFSVSNRDIDFESPDLYEDEDEEGEEE